MQKYPTPSTSRMHHPHQQPASRVHPPPQSQQRFAPQANARNASFRNPTPMSIQTRQITTRNPNLQELYTQNLENFDEPQEQAEQIENEQILEAEDEYIENIDNQNFPQLELQTSNP